jgi:prepilin-type N-terminal cleavage/methylation domain-containing protein
MRKKHNRGFTLLELIVALGLGVAVIGAAYAALSTSIDSSRRLDGYVEESTTLANLSETMKSQLTNVYFESTSTLAPVFTVNETTSAGQLGQLPGSSITPAPAAVTTSSRTASTGQAGQLPSDSITFSYARRGTAADSDPQFPYYTVTYWIADATSDSPGGLTREVTPLWLFDVADTPQDELIAPEVRGMAVSCFDGSTWTNQWDASSTGLPCAVRIDLYVDSARFRTDPWRLETPGANPATGFDPVHVVAWLKGAPAAAAATTTATATTSTTGTSSATRAATGSAATGGGGTRAPGR